MTRHLCRTHPFLAVFGSRCFVVALVTAINGAAHAEPVEEVSVPQAAAAADKAINRAPPYVGMGFGLGAPEALHMDFAAFPVDTLSVDGRAWSVLFFHGLELGVTGHLRVGRTTRLLGYAGGTFQVRTIPGESDARAMGARAGLGLAIRLRAVDHRFLLTGMVLDPQIMAGSEFSRVIPSLTWTILWFAV